MYLVPFSARFAQATLVVALMISEPSMVVSQTTHKKNDSPRIVNIVNFVRQCEPRIERFTNEVLYDTVVKQIEIMKQHQLRGTFLLQYDALIDPNYQKLLKRQPAEMFEIGAWWEIPQPLVEKSGYKWRGRFPWDWHANVGFSTGYTPEERERLVDTYMEEFKKVFGYYPRSVGSWFIDAHTLGYMHKRYGIVASSNCKDQIGTDGYTMWGGYWNQAYYPSKNNSYMPAQNAENQIPVPIFRMLGSDPIHQYDNGLGGNRQRVVSLEPVYSESGGKQEWCDWYFDHFVNGPAMGFGYTQAGQENSFTWNRMKKGFEIQMPMLAKLQKQGNVKVMTMAEAGQWFRQQYPVTPPTSVTVTKDYTDMNLKTVWFNSRFYRANLLWENGSMRFRDIHLFDETLASDYLQKALKSTQCLFDTLPIVDGFRWSSTEQIAGLRLMNADGELLRGGDPVVDDTKPGKLVIQWPLVDQGMIEFTFDEATIAVNGSAGIKEGWYFELTVDETKPLPFTTIGKTTVQGEYLNHAFQFSATTGRFIKSPATNNSPRTIFQIRPDQGKLVLDLTHRQSGKPKK